MPPITQDTFQELGEKTQNTSFIPNHPLLTPTFDYKLNSYDLESLMNAFLARQQALYKRLSREMGQLRGDILPTSTPEEKRKRIAIIRFDLH